MCHFPIIVLILPVNYILIYIIEHFEIHTPFFLFKKNFLKIRKGLIEEKLGRSYDNIYYTKFSPSKHRGNRNTQLAGGSPVSDGTDYTPREASAKQSR